MTVSGVAIRCAEVDRDADLIAELATS